MDPERHLERHIGRLERAVRFYRTLAAVLLLVVIVLASVVIVRGGRKFARALRIDGQIICLVKNVASAKRVHDLLLEKGKADLPGEAALEQQWQDETWPVDDNEVLSVREAVELLEGKVNVLVGSYVVEVDGVKIVNLPSKEFADSVLDALKASYVRQGEKIIGEPSFLEEVKVSAARARASEVTTDIHRAIKMLSGTKREEKTYTVRKGDFPEKIAQAYGMQVAELYRLNPKIGGSMLQPGQKLTVGPQKAAITVRTKKEITRTKKLEPEVETVYSPSILRGERRVAFPGEPGEKLVRVHQVYHNDELVKEVLISGRIVKSSSPRRVLIGTGDRPEEESGSDTEGEAGGADRPPQSATSEQ